MRNDFNEKCSLDAESQKERKKERKLQLNLKPWLKGPPKNLRQGAPSKNTLRGSWTVGGRQSDVWERLIELL